MFGDHSEWGSCHLKWEILLIPLCDFASNLISVMNPSVMAILGSLVSFTYTVWEDLSLGWYVTAGPEFNLSSVSSLMVQGLVLNAAVS